MYQVLERQLVGCVQLVVQALLLSGIELPYMQSSAYQDEFLPFLCINYVGQGYINIVHLGVQ